MPHVRARLANRRLWIAAAAAFVSVALLVQVDVVPPRIHVRWRADLTDTQRAERERRYGLASPRLREGTTWQYEIRNRSRDNIEAIVKDPDVEDTAYVDRRAMTVPGAEVEVSWRRARFLIGPQPWRLLQMQSLCAFAGGIALLLLAPRDDRRRARLAPVVILLVALAAFIVPMRQTIRMGDAATYTSSREVFESYAGVRQIRFEAHLSDAILGRLYPLFGPGEDAPYRTFTALMRLATAWFFVCALGIGFVERWSPAVVRYLGLTMFAPSTLLYFGYRELGFLSLNIAAFPLLARGLRDRTPRLEASGALMGLGAALHGFGLLSIAGAALAALATRARILERLTLLLRVLAWATALYLGWVAIYMIVLKLPVIPGHADALPTRPWFTDKVGDHERLNVALLSSQGLRDLFFTAWVIGAPLFVIVVSVWRQHRDEVRAALWYSVPAILFTVAFWPIQGLTEEMDLVFAAFPAIYALMWVVALDGRHTRLAAVLLASAHLAFWRIVLSTDFINSRIQ